MASVLSYGKTARLDAKAQVIWKSCPAVFRDIARFIVLLVILVSSCSSRKPPQSGANGLKPTRILRSIVMRSG
ncbi:hypothetical protein K491DRAFT_409785 [Lophiostoma macrostomum CBS 122681]|uniref:Uncharacterized protein n=1 Tax=Lophiostoma macrostomum CBS 122681 TaxID=1314788 RepID=A0A6A6T709_9PLEO|nr:hypothetical protein K491DRAFT_409785 [Lophiostoma macrostomum CBS 122681]